MGNDSPNISRKQFVCGAVAAGSVMAVGLTGIAYAEETTTRDEVEIHFDPNSYGDQFGFWVDSSKCIDCGTCAHKCRRANQTSEDDACRRKIIECHTSKGKDVFISTSCMHCLNPSCMAVCPAGAITKREQDGAVVVNRDRCIGCKYCFEACPFNVPKYNEQGMYKCDFCIENGTYPKGDPACVAGCPHDALHFGSIQNFLNELGDDCVRITGITGPSIIVS